MSFVATGAGAPVLPAIRELIAGADEVLLCSAFVDTTGMMLLAKELRQVAGRSRLVATSVFNGGRTLAAMDDATALGVECRLLNPGRGTFHPKVLLARHGDADRALVGSMNLTSGLVRNVEAAVLTEDGDGAVRRATESWWAEAVPLEEVHADREEDVIDPDLWVALREVLDVGTVVMTLGSSPRPNTIRGISRSGLLVETERSRRRGEGPQLVEPRMLRVAWDALRTEGVLTNRRLLDDLRVMRSSFVCAALATLPEVEVVDRRPITLRWRGGEQVLAAEDAGPFDS